MVRAGALFVAVTISFVIAVIVSMLILVAFHTTIQNKENLLQKKIDRNANSAMRLALASKSALEKEEIQQLDLYGLEGDSVTIRKSSWGIFELAGVRAYSGRYEVVKAALFGTGNYATMPSVYLVDFGEPLKLLGKTKIKGVSYIPNGKKGLQIGVVEKRTFEGKELSEGEVKESKNSLPTLPAVLLKRLAQLMKGSASGSDFKEVGLEEKDSLWVSFLDTTRVLNAPGSLSLANKRYGGNVIIRSNGIVTMDATSQLEDVVVIGNAVIIKKGFKGSVQAFAKDSIVVEEDCLLRYPSALGIFKEDYKTPQPFIQLKKGAELRGVAFTNQSMFVTDRNQTKISVETGAIVKGQVYADGFADIQGTVYGSVYCLKFSLKTKSSNYTNHLLDAVIDQTKLNQAFVGLSIQEEGTKQKIIKWLR